MGCYMMNACMSCTYELNELLKRNTISDIGAVCFVFLWKRMNAGPGYGGY